MRVCACSAGTFAGLTLLVTLDKMASTSTSANPLNKQLRPPATGQPTFQQ